MAENPGDYAYQDRWSAARESRELVKDSVNEFKDGAERAAEQAISVFSGAPQSGGAPGQGSPLGVEAGDVDTPEGLDWTEQTLPTLTFNDGTGGGGTGMNSSGSMTTTFNVEGFSVGSGSAIDEYTKPTDLASQHDYAVTALFSDIGAGWDLTNYRPAINSKPSLKFGDAPKVTVPDIGDQLPIVPPERPDLSMLTVPDAPGYTPQTIAVTINPASLQRLENQFDYTSERYQPQYLAAVIAKAQSLMEGALLIPAHVWDAMWSRGHGRLARQAHGALLEADTEFASRGWGRPGGSLNAARARIRSEIMGKAQDINLEKSIQQAAQVREDAIKGLELLATIDSVLEVFHAHHQERLLRGAVEANNAEIALYNAAVQAYQATEIAAKQLQLAVDDLKIKNELGKQEAHDRLLKGIEIVSRIDVNKVELFKAAWSGEETKQKAFLAWVESVKTNVEAQRLGVEAYGENAKAQQIIMQSWVSEWDAYVKYLEGTKTKATLAETRSNHFGRRVGYFQAADQSEARRFDADVTMEHKVPLEQSQLLLAQRETAIREMLGKLEAKVKPFLAQYQALGTLNQGEAARLGSLNQLYGVEIQKAGLALQAAIETVKEALGYWQTYQQAYTGWQGAYAGVLGQIGSAYASATNLSFGANTALGFDDSQTSTFTRSRGYNVSIQVPIDSASGGFDLNPPL